MLGREGREMPGVERPETVLDEMQVLDEVVALVRPPANETADVLARGGVDLPALGRRPPPPAAPPIRGNRIARGGVGGHHVARPRRAAPRHQERTPDGAPRPGGGRWLERAVIERGRSDIAIVLPPGWRPRDRRRRLRANFDRNRLRNPPRVPAG